MSAGTPRYHSGTQAGTRLGQYEILSPLGAGGMGEVYRARDSRLGRDVAIKVLPAETANDPAARRRFEQEARAVAMLSHANILAIHDFGTDGEISYAVTELLEGETLRDRITRGKLPWSEACRIGASIADGLAAAHGKGIIHRDLKPANVFLTADGQVKILDFGLARTEGSAQSSGITEVKTSAGTVLGTLGYMSPEQRRGEAVDPRTDIYALGCSLDEMVRDAPAALKRVIRRCLEPDRNARYHSARDLAIDLRAVSAPRHYRVWIAAAVVVIVAGVATFLLQRRAPPMPHEARSILVLPFENQNRSPDAEYLGDGIAEGLIGSLAELPGVRVIARTTAFRFKGKPIDLNRLRSELQVDAVLSGKLFARGNDVIVQADLIDTGAGTELWGKRFHEQSADLANIEQEIVGRISDALRVRLTPAQQTRIAARATRNPEAYRLYLQGQYLWNKRSPDGVRKAKNLFEQAIALDPQFALAHAGLADANNVGGEYHYLPEGDARIRAERAIRTALQLDPGLAEAHAALGHFEARRFHWRTAEREFRKALEINPNYASAYQRLAVVLLVENRVDEALSVIRKAEQVDPLSVLLIINEIAELDVKGDYAGALAASRRALDLDAGYAWAYLQMGGAYEGLGQLEKAAGTYDRGARVPGPPGFHEFFVARAAAVRGDRGPARMLAQEAEKRTGEVSPAVVACIYAAAADRDKAIEWFNRAIDARDSQIAGTVRAPIVKELRGDPRYDALLRRVERGFDD